MPVQHRALGGGVEMHSPHRWTVANISARNALTVTIDDIGKYCWLLDTRVEYILSSVSPTVWTKRGPTEVDEIPDAGTKGRDILKTTTSAGARAAIDLGNVDNTSDVNKPVSMAQGVADALVASNAASALSGHTSNTGNPHSTTKAQVGLGNADNTSDINKPVSTLQAAADTVVANNAAAALSGHTGNTSNPHSTTKAQVGLGNADNTSDINKPVSTLQAAADVAVANAASSDATTKANTAQANAISTASGDATTKANTAQSNAIAAAAVDATSKANTAQSNAIATAASDATTKANTAENNAKSYADGLVVGLWDDRGNYNASTNLWPSSGGSGTAGAILKGDVWTVSVAGTLGGSPVAVRQTIRALVDAPAQTAGNWAISSGNTDIDDSITNGVVSRAPSQNAVFDALLLKEPSISLGTTAQYWRGDKSFADLGTSVRAIVLLGLSLATSTPVTASDTILQALGKTQAQINLKLNQVDPVYTGTMSGVDLILSSNASVMGSLSVTGNSTFSNSLTIGGGVTVTGALSVADDASFAAGLTSRSLFIQNDYALSSVLSAGGAPVNLLRANADDSVTLGSSTWSSLKVSAGASDVLTVNSSGLTVAGTTTSTTFVGALTGAASSNVLKSGDTMTGNLTFSGNGRRITALMNGTPYANRLMFQTSTVNGNSNLSVIPNGSGTASALVAHSSSDPDNSNLFGFTATNSAAQIQTFPLGSATAVPMTFSVNSLNVLTMATNGLSTFEYSVQIAGVGRRILGDLSDATHSNRLMFQSSVLNGASTVGVVPNGSGTSSGWRAFGLSDPTNSHFVTLSVNATSATLHSDKFGTGVAVPLVLATAGLARLTIDTSGSTTVNTGNLIFGSTGQRITGDFSNSTRANRLLFQGNNASNLASVVGVIPMAGGTIAGYAAFTSSDPDNAAQLQLLASNTGLSIGSVAVGTGIYQPLNIVMAGVNRLTFDTAGNVQFIPTASVDIAGNLSLSGTARRILGDFSNATVASRLTFQTTTVNGDTRLGVIPNGTSVVSLLGVFGGSDPDNSPVFNVAMVTSVGARLSSTKNGSGTFQPLSLLTSDTVRLTVGTTGEVALSSTTEATTSTAAALTVAGGLAVAKYSIFGLGWLSQGDVAVTKTNPALIFSKGASGQYAGHNYRTGANSRWWLLYGDDTAESGSNVGSEIRWDAYDDAGSYLSTWLRMYRASGNLGLYSTTDATSHTAAALTVAGGLGVAKKVYIGGGELRLVNGTSNALIFEGFGINAPTFTTRSVGTKIVLFPNIGASSVDYALGITANTLWSSVPDAAGQFQWYAGTTLVGQLTGIGELSVAQSVTAPILYVNPTSAIVDSGANTLGFSLGGSTWVTFSDTTNIFQLKTLFGDNIEWTPPSSVTLAVNGRMSFQATSNTSATLKYRGSDGVTRSVSFTLA